MTALVTCVIPTYLAQDGTNKLETVVQSITANNEVGCEIILVDDASQRAPKIRGLQDVRIIRHDLNRGPARARNTGIQAAQGDLIAFLDADDLWLPGKLSRQIDLYRSLSQTHNPDLLAIGCGFYDPDRRTGRLRARIPIPADSTRLFASGIWFAPGSTILISRKAFDIVGLQDESLKRLEDLDWFIRFGLAGGKFFSTPSPDVIVRPSGNASTTAVRSAAKSLIQKFARDGTHSLGLGERNRLAAYLALEKMVAAYSSGQYGSCFIELCETFLRKPRLRAALERFWLESQEIPPEVARLFNNMG